MIGAMEVMDAVAGAWAMKVMYAGDGDREAVLAGDGGRATEAMLAGNGVGAIMEVMDAVAGDGRPC